MQNAIPFKPSFPKHGCDPDRGNEKIKNKRLTIHMFKDQIELDPYTLFCLYPSTFTYDVKFLRLDSLCTIE